jgi:putative transposase
MSDEERQAALADRRRHFRPWHSPPHLESESGLYLVTGSCFEHHPIIGQSWSRMGDFSDTLCETFEAARMSNYAWAILPNHYHALVKAAEVSTLIRSLGHMHGRTSFSWNGEDNCRDRQVWFNLVERSIRTERHFWASLIYVLNNPVKHGYVERWPDWPFSNAAEWLESVGRDEALRIWKEFPIDDYGQEWDPPDL